MTPPLSPLTATADESQRLGCLLPKRAARPAAASPGRPGEPAPEEGERAGGGEVAAVQRDSRPPPEHREHPERSDEPDQRAGER